MRAALYARVSTDRQERDQTIDNQLTALRAWVLDQNHELAEEHIYRDEGWSGARLDRPGLDALRDAVHEGAVDLVAVLTPDRLTRRYAYQVLLIEEFRRAGCQLIFVQRPITEDPNDQLLLQIQGAVAEYERALLSERFRRGKLQKARAGQYLAGRAPYGYRYVPRQDSVAGHLVIDDSEAELVRTLYQWLIDEPMTIRQILKRLNFGPWFPRSGRRPWSPSTVHHILSDPVYTGTAYVNRYDLVLPKKPRAQRKPSSAERSCRRLKPQEQWIPIPVPALVEQSTWDRAQEQLARNATLSFRHNSKYHYLLRCLLTCQFCGLAMFGRTSRASSTHRERRYYLCHGKDCILSARQTPCPRRSVPAECLEKAVWEHVAGLLRNPAQLAAQFEQFLASTAAGTAQEQEAQQQAQTRLDRLTRADQRLLDAYQAGAITVAELSERRTQIAQQCRALDREQKLQQRLRQQRTKAEEVLLNLEAFADRVRLRLTEADFTEKQAILQLVIEHVIVGEDTLEIRHVIPLRSPVPDPGGHPPPGVPLRSDGVIAATLYRLLSAEHFFDGGSQCFRAIDHE